MGALGHGVWAGALAQATGVTNALIATVTACCCCLLHNHPLLAPPHPPTPPSATTPPPQARQLPLLAPVLPTKRPTLHSATYELVLAALLADPAHHGALLRLVQGWPNSLYQPAALIDAIAQRMQRPGGDTRELWQVRCTLC